MQSYGRDVAPAFENESQMQSKNQSASGKVRRCCLPRIYRPMVLPLSLVAVCLLFEPLTWSVQHSMQDMHEQDMHDMDDMHHTNNNDVAKAAALKREQKRLSDKRESEMSHHIAGFLVAFAGLFALWQCQLSSVSPRLRLFWPYCFLGASVFLLLFSDTEIWPMGSQSLWYAINHDAEDLQHKMFALILLALGVVEYQRLRGRWKTPLTPWVFSLGGLAGAVLLLFHRHSMDMHHASAMQLMQHIETQHRWYAGVGVGIVTVKQASEFPSRWQKLFTIVWPVLLITLGVSLVLYTE